MILKKLVLALLAGLMLPGSLTAQNGYLDRLFLRMKDANVQDFRSLVDSVYLSLDDSGSLQYKREVAKRLFRITREKDEVAHIRSLTYMVVYSDTPRPELFDQAFALAQKHSLIKEMDYVEDRRSRYFISLGRYDSAMNHILKMRDLQSQEPRNEEYRNVLNLLADIYYNANLYDKAREVYLELYSYYAMKQDLSYWRFYVVMDNLGQIGLKTKNYEQALFWFGTSLKNAERGLTSEDGDNILTYIHLKLSESFLLTGNRNEAVRHLGMAEKLAAGNIREDVLQELIYMRSRIMLSEGNTDGALQQAISLLPSLNDRFSQYRFVPDIYRLLADIYAEKNDQENSLKYLNVYSRAVDSIENQGRIARTMVILAEKDNQIERERLKNARQKFSMLLTGTAILAVMFVILGFLYWRLYQSRLLLVRKSLEESRPGKSTEPVIPPGIQSDADDQGLADIIAGLEKLMQSTRVYLDPELDIQKLAQMLSTNRTYLSKAINGILGTTFPQYIADLRIREAVKLISEGFMVKNKQETLARACGFSNRSVFISTFKKQTGVTPSFFISNYKQTSADPLKESAGPERVKE
jgi:AraC-like DNA-binding protein